MNKPDDSALGQVSQYEDHYNPALLYPIPRATKREEIGIDEAALPFFGVDIWNHYEVSWLNAKGKPQVAIAQICYDCRSCHIVESKSLKLYFNSLNNTQYDDWAQLQSIIAKDLSAALHADVLVKLMALDKADSVSQLVELEGDCIDDLDISCSRYQVAPDYLSAGGEVVEEALLSNLLKSNCLVTHQPDWGSVQIQYRGPGIDREGLLRYIVSFRNHNEFHEQCIERIYTDILQYCKPEFLTVIGRYTRRGGIDINPVRSSSPIAADGQFKRLVRQ